MKKIIFLCAALLLFVLPWEGMSQGPGFTCGNPLVVYNVPFSHSGDLVSYGNDYSSSDKPGNAPGAITNGTGTSSYLNGFEVVYSYTAGSNGSIDINTTNDNAWVALWVFSGCPFSSTLGYHTNSSGTTRSIPNLPVVAGQTYYIVISNWDLDPSTNFTINITGTQVLNPPTCLPPSNLSVSDQTGSSVKLGWTEGGTATQWDIEWGAKGFTPTGTPNITGTTTNPHPLAGLAPQTEYDFYVRADCGSGDLSTWTGPYTFETACAVQLSGPYNIGSGGNYTSLTAAVSDLNTCGVSGNVVFNVLPGSGPYNEQLTITEFMGSDTYSVTFNGNGETLTASTVTGARSLFLLDGADNITIKNFNLKTIEATNNFVIQLINDANFNTISNNTIDMSSTLGSTASTNAGIVSSGSLTSATTAGNNSSNLTITGNTIIGGYYGIVLNGPSSSSFSMNNTISGNTVQDFYYYGVYMKSTSGSSVSGNDIHRANRSSVSTFYGIYYLTNGDNNTTNANKIHDAFTASSSSSSTAYCIYHSSVDATPGNENIVSNNVIYNINSASGTIYALYNSGSDGVNYYYNTVSLDHAASTSGSTYGFYQSTGATGIDLKNNIIAITRGGTGTKYALYFNTAASVITSDYNDLYVNAAAGTNGVGYSGAAQVTLADWQTKTGGDANSLDLDPMFAAPLFGGLSPTNPAVDDMGTPIAGITTDIDGTLRDATNPDMGAYEFTPPSCLQPGSLAANNITSTSAKLTWVENGTASNWTVEYGAAGFIHGNGTSVTVNGTPEYNIPAGTLTADTSYEFYVKAVCGGSDVSTWTGPAGFYTGYCKSTTANNNTYIEDFTASGNSTQDIVNTNSGSSLNGTGYSDFTTLPGVKVTAGGVVNFTANINLGETAGLRIWVDWNHSLAFGDQGASEPDEVVYSSTSYLRPHSGNFTVPSVAPGTYRLRVGASYIPNSGPADPCGLPSYGGEYEDYTLIVVAQVPGYVYKNGGWMAPKGDPSGVSTASDDVYVMSGTASLTADTAVNDLIIYSGATLNVNKVLNLNGDITNNGNLVFVSTATGEGELGIVAASSTITGNATVQRYMQDKRSYRMVSSAVTTTTSIHANWQEGATSNIDNPSPTFGTHITGTSSVDQTDGFDKTITGNPSMFYVPNGSQTFTAIANTNVNTLSAGNPYLLFVRGDRSIDLTDPTDKAHSATTLRATGALFTGSQTQNFSSNPGDFVMFGNPYQCAVDVSAVFSNSNNVNNNHYYVYDPSLGDHGAYVTVKLSDGSNTAGSAANQYLQPGQAGQAQVSGTASIVFSEGNKVPGAGSFTSTNRSISGSDKLIVQLYTTDNFKNGGPIHDSFGILFANGNDNGLTATDAIKPSNFYENLGIDHNGIYLSLEERDMPQPGEVYPLYSTGYSHSAYTLKMTVDGLDATSFYLDDHFTGTSTLLANGENIYHFNVDGSNDLSVATNRFSIHTAQRLGVDNNNLLSGISLYPNPLNGNTFYINAPQLDGEQLSVSISDISGRRIFDRMLECTSGTITVPMGENMAAGVYLVTLKQGGNTNTYRLIKN